MATLIIADCENNQLAPTTGSVISAAQEIGGDIDLFVSGHDTNDIVSNAQSIAGVRKVWVAEGEEYAHPLAESLTPLVVNLAPQYTHILASASTFGKNLLPRIAAVLDMAVVSDVCKIIAPHVYERYCYAGNILATVKNHSAIQVLTIRTTAFSHAEKKAPSSASTESISSDSINEQSRFMGIETHQSDRPDLTTANTVIAGGRGLGSKENFSIIETLAHKLNAAIGASRAAVDAGYAPNDWQVGQTGKVVAPKLYIAIGISGAIQHTAGMKDSQVIVAINKDADAPIFQAADYGLVADLFKVLPQFIELLAAR